MLKNIADLANEENIKALKKLGFNRVEYFNDFVVLHARVKNINTLIFTLEKFNKTVCDTFVSYWAIKDNVHINIDVPKCPECDSEIFGGNCVCKTSEVV